MTALDFARQNLFEPLGIQDVRWPTDTQGFNDGWGYVYLHPRDAAKTGLLWLNGGMWEGKQIVSRAWVQASVTRQITTGLNDDYGYGWWVMKHTEGERYAAIGRSGQRISVLPSLNAVLVFTGGGFEPDEVTRLLAPAVIDVEKPLPANPSGTIALDAALTAIAQPPAPTALAPLPALAQTISGKTFVFDANPQQLKTLRLDFDDPAAGKLLLTFADDQAPRAGTIGLDGVYRLSPGRNNFPAGMRGFWSDAQTLVVEYDEIANREAFALRIRFSADRVVMDIKERTHELGFTVTGRHD